MAAAPMHDRAPVGDSPGRRFLRFSVCGIALDAAGYHGMPLVTQRARVLKARGMTSPSGRAKFVEYQ